VAKAKTRRRAPAVAQHDPGSDDPRGVRLQKWIAQAGVASRRKAEAMIVAGQVKVNGRVVRELGTRVDPAADRVEVSGRQIKPEPRVYYVLNKPDGVVCSAEGAQDDRGRPTVIGLLHGVVQRVYPVGRLDYHSRGVLILTNDGDLSDALTHPRSHVEKVYHVKFQGRLDPADLDQLREGVTLEDGTVTLPATELFLVKETEANTWVQIGLRQGLNRQLRRMGEAIGHPVLKLIRVAIGDVTTDGLEEGAFRTLRETEVAALRASIQSRKH
jgi:23S rRNA pseudouridine2605 synthase